MTCELSRSRYMGVGIALAIGLLLTLFVLVGIAGAGEPASYPARSPVSDDIGVMAATASITGRVTANSPSGPPLVNAFVYLIDSVTNISVTTTTDSGGYYSATITADSDKVKAYFVMTGCASLYYNGKASSETADVISLTHGSIVTGVNAALPQLALGSISGIVTDAVTTNPLPTTTVRLYDAGSHTALSSTLTNQGGAYTLTGLTAGRYKVGFDRQGSGAQFYAYTDTLTQATVLTLSVDGVITDVNGALGAGTGCLTGVVAAASNGVPLDGVTVTLYVPMSPFEPITQTKAVTLSGTGPVSGSYQFCGLSGAYLVGFTKRLYVPEWYDNRTALQAADRVTVTNAYTTPNINAALLLGGCIGGRVQGTDGVTRPGAVVTVYNALSVVVGYPVSPAPASVETFRICELSSGNYQVRCADSGLEGQIMATVTAAQVTTDVICVVADQRYLYLPVITRS